MTPPRIAVLVALRPSQLGADYDSVVRGLTERAVRSVTDAGGDAVLHDLATEPPRSPSQVVDNSDGLLVLGGADVDPTLYDEEPAPETVIGSRADDEFEIAVIRAALDDDLPVLAVCRGAQLLNVALGGTLVQDLGPDSPHHGPPEALMVDTDIRVVEDSRLASLLGAGDLTVRTGNHQAIGRVAHGLRVTARADDGVVEAIEDPESWVLGVQFHPEDGDADPEHLAALTNALVQAVRSRRLRSRNSGSS